MRQFLWAFALALLPEKYNGSSLASLRTGPEREIEEFGDHGLFFALAGSYARLPAAVREMSPTRNERVVEIEPGACSQAYPYLKSSAVLHLVRESTLIHNKLCK